MDDLLHQYAMDCEILSAENCPGITTDGYNCVLRGKMWKVEQSFRANRFVCSPADLNAAEKAAVQVHTPALAFSTFRVTYSTAKRKKPAGKVVCFEETSNELRIWQMVFNATDKGARAQIAAFCGKYSDRWLVSHSFHFGITDVWISDYSWEDINEVCDAVELPRICPSAMRSTGRGLFRKWEPIAMQ